MNKSVLVLGLITAAVSTYACVVSILLFASIALYESNLNKANTQEAKIREAKRFFYTTMHVLSEGTYDPNDSSTSQWLLDTFREYELGDKCWVYLGDDSSGYHAGLAFFPSGDVFYVRIVRFDERLGLAEFNHEDWDRRWSGTLR